MQQKTSKYLVLLALCFLFGLPLLWGQEESINWMTWEEAMIANEKEPRKKYVDVYTDWCGYCKKMDATTFKDPDVIKYINENFYPIKFNAEQKGEITFNGFTFKYVKNNSKRGYHQLAQSLLNGKLGYPSFVLLDEEDAKILLSPGYKTKDMVMKELQFAHLEKYKVQSFKDFRRKPAVIN